MSDDQPALPFDASADPRPGPVTVDELLGHIGSALRDHGLDDVTVRGVLTGWRRTRTWGQGDLITPGLTDGDVVARLPIGVPGRAAAALEAQLERDHPGVLAANPVVDVVGGLEIHPRYGPLRLVARAIVVDADETRRAGDERARTMRMLHDRGVFDRQRALRLPDRVTSVGVIAGSGTAAGADFQHRLGRHAPDLLVQQLQVVTAGPDAAQAIAAALGRLDRRRLDCIALLRGGGPAVDLTVFDDPDLVTAIGLCSTPVLTGIGHATDATVADRAAHLALPTPSAVADQIVHHNTAVGAASAAQAQGVAERAAAAAAEKLDAERVVMADVRARLRLALIACAVLAVLVVALIAR